MEEKNQNEEKVNVRHTITAEETFTLAKDVFDIRCFIKNVYANRAVISRRLDILTLSVSTVFMLLYTAFVTINALAHKLNTGVEIALYAMLGLYAALFIAFLIVYACSARARAKSVRKYKLTLKTFKIIVRCLTIAVSIAAMVFAGAGGELSAKNMALDILIIVFSVITLIFQLIPLMFGGTAKLVRWLLSPVKIKYRFSKVVLEWYELAVTGEGGEGIKRNGVIKKVSKKYFDEIGVLIDSYIVPQLGDKYITAIKPAMLLNLVDKAADSEKPLLEGTLKNIFAYAAECGYVTFDPCKDLPFSGSVEEPEKPQKQTMKGRLLKVGQKIGMSMLDKYIDKNSDSEE